MVLWNGVEVAPLLPNVLVSIAFIAFEGQAFQEGAPPSKDVAQLWYDELTILSSGCSCRLTSIGLCTLQLMVLP
jgi:hypothetical protein